MLKSLECCYKEKKVVSIYTNLDDTNSHLTGYVVGFNNHEVLIAHISAHGLYDGFILKCIDDIYRIDYSSEYEQKIENLYKHKKQTHPNMELLNLKRDLFCALLDYAQDNELVITFEFEDNYLSGFVEYYTDKTVNLKVISDYGYDNGISIIDIDKVLTVSVDTDDEQDIKMLYNSLF